jgi:chitinase
MSSAPLKLQRMRPAPVGSGPSPAPLFPVVGVTSDNSAIVEGSVITFRIKRVAGPSYLIFAVHWAMTGDALDMTGIIAGDVNFAAEDMEKVITVTTVLRPGAQGDRGVTLSLSAPTGGATLDPARTSASVLISDDSGAPPASPIVGVDPVLSSATEGTIVQFTARRTRDNVGSTAFTVGWAATSDGGSADITGTVSGTLSFAANEMSKVVNIQTVNRTGLQGDRALRLTLSSPSGATLDPTKTVGITTLKDFTTPVTTPIVGVAADTPTVFEGNTAGFTVSRNGGSLTTPFTVHWVVVSSLHPNDFDDGVVTSGDLSFASGDLTKPLSFKTRARTAELQGDRQLTVTLSAPVNADLDPARTSASMMLKDTIISPGLPKYQPTVPNSKIHWVGAGAPAGVKKVYTGDYTGLKNAMSDPSYMPGDKIKIANGVYSGADITLGRSGIAAADGSTFLMIEAVNHLKVTLDFRIIQAADYWWFSGCKLPKAAPYRTTGFSWDGTDIGTFSLRAKGLWVTNCRFTSWCIWSLHAGLYDVNKVSNLRFCYNDMPADVPAEAYSLGLMYITKLDKADNIPDDVEIAYNKGSILTNPGRGGDAGSRFFLQIQPSKPSPSTPVNATRRAFNVHHNWVRGYLHYITYTKRQTQISYNVFRCLGTYYPDGGSIQRHGNINGTPAYDTGSLMEGNLYIHEGNKPIQIQLNGYGSICNGNKAVTAGATSIQLSMGTMPAPSKSGEHDAASYSKVIDCVGFDKVIVGDVSDPTDTFAPERGGYCDKIRIGKGGNGWDPTVTNGGNCAGGEHCTSANWTVVSGNDGEAVITTVDEAALLLVCGCDPEA